MEKAAGADPSVELRPFAHSRQPSSDMGSIADEEDPGREALPDHVLLGLEKKRREEFAKPVFKPSELKRPEPELQDDAVGRPPVPKVTASRTQPHPCPAGGSPFLLQCCVTKEAASSPRGLP